MIPSQKIRGVAMGLSSREKAIQPQLMFFVLVFFLVVMWVGVARANTEDSQEVAPSASLPTSEEGASILFGNRIIPDCLRLADQVRVADGQCLIDVVTHATSLLLFIAGLAALLYILYGAFMYTTSFGEESKAERAKKIITNSVIGLILASLSYAAVEALKSLLRFNGS